MPSLIDKCKRLMKRQPLLLFFHHIWPGYREYGRLAAQYGVDMAFFAVAWKGTGDYYLCCSFLPEWLKREGIKDFRFMTPGGSEQKTLDLFPEARGRGVRLNDVRAFYNILRFQLFLGEGRCNVHNFQQQQNITPLGPDNLAAGELQGFNGLTMADLYQYGGFALPEDTARQEPEFDWDEEKLRAIFSQHGLRQGKTVMLSPYSTGLEAYRPPLSFWVSLTGRLRNAGFTVCTNCSGSEMPIRGTEAVFVPYSLIVPFLERAGAFVGLRSGLCDIISTARCRKIIIHLYKAKWWPDGNSIPYVGLNNMGLCDDAVELEYGRDNRQDNKLPDALLRSVMEGIGKTADQ